MSPEYLAGFFDGEGCIDVQISYPAAGQSRFYCRPRIRIAQAQSGRVVIDCPHQRFGGTLLERKAGNDRQQPSISWELLGKEGMVPMLELLIPYLILKREQAKLALWWLNNMSGRQGKNGTNLKLEAARRSFAEELQMMKRDPQRLSEAAVARIEQLMR